MPGVGCQCDIELLLSACNHPYTVHDSVADETYRNRAYNAYLKIRSDHPNSRIIITGHSLGGHLAQEVALHAMAEG